MSTTAAIPALLRSYRDKRRWSQERLALEAEVDPAAFGIDVATLTAEVG